MTLQNMGVNARSFMGWQLVRASGVHGNARVDAIEKRSSTRHCPAARSPSSPASRASPKTDGWRRWAGAGPTRRRWHRRRRRADRCDIYTDVDGVYTTDPRIVPRARKLTHVTFEEMLELAGVGAKVLQVRSVGVAMRESLPLRVLSAFEDVPGTDIVAELSGADMERNEIAGIAADRNEARITLTGIADRPGTVAAVITPLAEAGDRGRHDRPRRNPERAKQATSPSQSRARAWPRPERRWRSSKGEIGYGELLTDDSVAKVSIVGVGIRSNPQLAATMFEVLAERRHQHARRHRRPRSR
jgi:aspartate kinase